MKYAYPTKDSFDFVRGRLKKVLASTLPSDALDKVHYSDALAVTLGFTSYTHGYTKWKPPSGVANQVHSCIYWDDDLANRLYTAEKDHIAQNAQNGIFRSTIDFPDLLAKTLGHNDYVSYCVDQEGAEYPNYDLRFDDDLSKLACAARARMQADLLRRYLVNLGIADSELPKDFNYLVGFQLKPTAKCSKVPTTMPEEREKHRQNYGGVGLIALDDHIAEKKCPDWLSLQIILSGFRAGEGEQTLAYKNKVHKLASILLAENTIEAAKAARELLEASCRAGCAYSHFLLAKFISTQPDSAAQAGRIKMLIRFVHDRIEAGEYVFGNPAGELDFEQFANRYSVGNSSKASDGLGQISARSRASQTGGAK